MHDPDVLLFDVPVIKLDIWHREPRGHDAFEVCGYPPALRCATLARIVWTVRHVRHLRPRWWPAFKLRHWVTDRCDHCGYRFHRGQARYSYQSTDKVWHDACMSLQHAQSQLDDLTGYVLGTADSNAKWRAKYRLDGLAHPELVGNGY